MTAKVSDIDQIREWCRAGVYHTAQTNGTTEMLLWILIRQEADHQLALLKDDHETHSDTSD